MIDSRKEAMLQCIRTGIYTPYKLPDSHLPVSGGFSIKEGSLIHIDLEAKMEFNNNGK